MAESLQKYFYQNLSNIDFGDYSMHRCSNCTLEFASPLVPGSDSFYNWLAMQTGYYPASRWEWDPLMNDFKGEETLSPI